MVLLPNRAAEMDGSRSFDDHEIVEYEWSRDPKSPAAGVSVRPSLMGDMVSKETVCCIGCLNNFLEWTVALMYAVLTF